MTQLVGWLASWLPGLLDGWLDRTKPNVATPLQLESKQLCHKSSFVGARQLVKLSDFERFPFAYNPGLILNMWVF